MMGDEPRVAWRRGHTMKRSDRQGMKTSVGFGGAPAVPAVKPAAATVPVTPAMPAEGDRATPLPPRGSTPSFPPASPRAASVAPPPPPPAGTAGSSGRKYTPPNPVQTEAGRMSEITRGPLVEVDVSYERGVSPTAEPLRIAVEVWTQNNVYALDARMRCVAVRSQESKSLVDDHPFLGTRLVGGQIKGEGSVEMSYPLPRPGSFAVFEGRRGKKRRFSRTSVVEKVVLRLRVVTVTGPDAAPSWEDLVHD